MRHNSSILFAIAPPHAGTPPMVPTILRLHRSPISSERGRKEGWPKFNEENQSLTTEEGDEEEEVEEEDEVGR